MDSNYLSSLFGLDGKTAVVVGAGGGLGRGAALALARAGAHVIVAARNEEQLDHTAELIAEAGGTAAAQPLDIADEDAVDRFFGEAGPIDIVVNTAVRMERSPALDMSRSAWRDMMDVNLTGAFTVLQAAARAMVARGTPGRIVQYSSVQAYLTLPNRVAYSSAKAGLVQLVKSFAYELGDSGVTVNAILPGFFTTALNQHLFTESSWFEEFKKHVPLGRAGQASELDAALLYLVSPMSSYTTGTTVVVDGALTAGIPL